MTAQRVLVINEDAKLSESIHGFLLGKTCECQLMSGWKEAEVLSPNSTFDLIILDEAVLKSPGFDRVTLRKFNCPIFLMSSTPDAFATETFPKPLDWTKLAEAIELYLHPKPDATDRFHKVGITDFLSGRSIKFGIFLKLPNGKFVKVAHKSEDLPADRVAYYRSKGVHFLYIKHADFRAFVGLDDGIHQALSSDQSIHKLEFMEGARSIISEKIPGTDGKNPMVQAATAFAQASIDLITDEAAYAEFLYQSWKKSPQKLVQRIGVGIYSLMIAQQVEWNLPTNKFKLVLGALFCDMGAGELKCDFLMRPKETWTAEQRLIFDSNVQLANSILKAYEILPTEIKEIIRQHMEIMLARINQMPMKRSTIRPITKLLMVSEEFGLRVITHGKAPEMAVGEMVRDCGGYLDKTFFGALGAIFEPTSTK